ncbi:proton-conducting transporter transmembrane domain-containing protein [Candidatus Cytomitobacter primus]|uniref:proton-conducting transporter transmembrane domain-containing protein n=1 Tax=Candidatus Cytomitobacter primus TaxID=2066024 RepID=UPI00165343E7|nr:proton-conducting transporter membrane subunit [Candidatus Cytomitobacter primus]
MFILCSVFMLVYDKSLYNFDSKYIQVVPHNIGVFITISSSILTAFALFLNPDLSVGLLTSLYGIYKITSTTDFFNMYVGYEVLLSGFVFCLIKSQYPHWKLYLKYQMLASFILFFGVCLFYLENGHLGIFYNQKPFFNAYILLLGFLIKAGAYPFGLWIALYSKIPNQILFWASGLITKISVYSILVLMPWLSSGMYNLSNSVNKGLSKSIVNPIIILLSSLYNNHTKHSDIIMHNHENLYANTSTILSLLCSVGLGAISILSAIIGAILAYKSLNSKKILSFHIMSQIGIILNIAVFEFHNQMNFGLTILYLTHHIWTKSTLFLMVDDKQSWLCKYAALSLIGFPITPGFIAKFSALYFMIQKHYYIGAMSLILSSIITAFSVEKFMNSFEKPTKNLIKNVNLNNDLYKTNIYKNDLYKKHTLSIISLVIHYILMYYITKIFIICS